MLKVSLIKDYPNYTIDIYGNVTNIISGKVLKPRMDKNGYQRVRLYKNSIGTNFLIHRLVAIHFIENPQNLPEVNHIDEDKTNNRIENLEWCSTQYNINYGSGLIRRSKSKRKSVVQYDLNGTLIKIWESPIVIEEELNINRRQIYNCCQSKRKTAGGFTWEYLNNTENYNHYA